MFHDIPVLAGEMASTAKASLQKNMTGASRTQQGPTWGCCEGPCLTWPHCCGQKELCQALACLQSAAAARTCKDALLSAPQVLGPITATAVPATAVPAMQLLQGKVLHLLLYRLSVPPWPCSSCSAHCALPTECCSHFMAPRVRLLHSCCPQ